MKKIATLFSLIFLVFSALLGCGKPNLEVARVNKHIITLTDVEDRISKLPPRYRSEAKEDRAEFIDDIINDYLLYDEAVHKRLFSDRDLKKVIEEAKKKIVIARLIKDEVEDKVRISDDELKKYFESHQSEFISEPRYRASHILVSSSDTAKLVEDKLKKGEPFETLARDYSEDSTSKRGGDIGYFRKGELISEFENVCLNLDIGKISPVTKTQFGYHIIKLTDKVPSQLKNFDEIKEDIRNILKSAKRKELFNALITRVRSRAEIKINSELIKSSSRN